MMAGNKVPTIQLPLEARHAIWRIFGNGLAPKKQQTWHDLAAPIIQSRLGKTDESGRVIAEIRGWFDPDGGASQLRPDMREPVAEMIIDGIGRALSETAGVGNHDTAFWAMGSIGPDVASAIIRSSWRPEQIEAFAGYALDTLERLHGKGEIIDPKYVFGRDIQLDFTHFKRHKRGNLQYDGTEWRGVSVHRSWRSIVKNPPTPTTSGYAQR